MEWREIILELNSMPPQKLNYIAERYSSWLNKVVRGRRGYARIIPVVERVTKLAKLIKRTTGVLGAKPPIHWISD